MQRHCWAKKARVRSLASFDMGNGIELKLFPLPVAGQVGRRGLELIGCAVGSPTAAGFAGSRTSGIYSNVLDTSSRPGFAFNIVCSQHLTLR